jgi:hypothetical protein
MATETTHSQTTRREMVPSRRPRPGVEGVELDRGIEDVKVAYARSVIRVAIGPLSERRPLETGPYH